MVDRAGSAEGLAYAELQPGLTTYRAGSVEVLPTATFTVGRPYDLLTLDLEAGAGADAEPTRFAGGATMLDGLAVFDAEAIRYAFFANLDASSECTVSAWRVVAGAVQFESASEWEADDRRRIGSDAEGWATAEMQAVGIVYRGGLNHFDAGADLQIYAIVNGVHEANIAIDAGASLDATGTRLAGVAVLADGRCDFHVEADPWLGSVADGTAAADMFATWWTFVHSQSTSAVARSELSAEAFVFRAGAADVTGRAEGEAIWSRWVEPSVLFSQGLAGSCVTAWRTRHEAVEVIAHAGASVSPYRVSFRSAQLDASATAETRAFINFTNDAPDWRSMTVPAERRVMVVPFENRTMVVR